MFRLASILLISLMLAFRPLIPILEYLVNYQYIAQELCENSDKPKMRCNGKCYLAKEMSKAAEETQPTNQQTKVSVVKTIDAFILQKWNTSISVKTFLKPENNFSHCEKFYYFHFIQTLIKPPIQSFIS